MAARVYAWIFCIVVVCFFSPLILFAQTSVTPQIQPGCHATTPEEAKAMADRGIPQKYEVCPADEKILGIGQSFDQWYARIKSDPKCQSNQCTLSCRVRNTGAQVCGPTATRWNAIGCHPHNRTAIFPTVAHGFAAHIELLKRYCSERQRCTINSAIMQWAPPTVHNNSTASYIAFVSRVAGMPANQVYDPNDADLMGRIAMAMSCYEAGSMPYPLQDLKQGLTMASGGPRVPVPANVGQLLQESMAAQYTPIPGSPGSYPGSWGYPQSSLVGGRYMPPPVPPNPQPLPIIDTYGNQGGAGVTPPPPPPPSQNQLIVFPPASLIIAQPASMMRGEAATVSWTSVGMKATGCTVYNGATILAQSTQGTVTVPTDATGESIVFILKCETPSGEIKESNTSVRLI